MTENWKLGLSFTLLTVLMWGLLPLALKVVLAVMDPITISWYRFSLSALIALLWYGHRRTGELKALLSRSVLPLTALATLGLTANYLLYIWGLDYTNPATAQILIQLAPLLLIIGSVILFKEQLTPWQWLGVLGFTVGLALFFHQRWTNLIPTNQSYIIGILLLLAASVSWTSYGLAQKKMLTQFHAQDILLMICLVGTVFLLPLSSPLDSRHLTPWQWTMLLFCGLNTIVAYGSFGLAMTYWSASRASAIIPIAPLMTILFTVLIEHFALADLDAEPLDALSYCGALLVVIGSATAALAKTRSPE